MDSFYGSMERSKLLLAKLLTPTAFEYKYKMDINSYRDVETTPVVGLSVAGRSG